MKKRLFALLLAAVMLLGLTAAALADPEATATPEVTEEPGPSEEPEPTEEPESSEAPEPTEEPGPSEEPEPTEEPEEVLSAMQVGDPAMLTSLEDGGATVTVKVVGDDGKIKTINGEAVGPAGNMASVENGYCNFNVTIDPGYTISATIRADDDVGDEDADVYVSRTGRDTVMVEVFVYTGSNINVNVELTAIPRSRQTVTFTLNGPSQGVTITREDGQTPIVPGVPAEVYPDEMLTVETGEKSVQVVPQYDALYEVVDAGEGTFRVRLALSSVTKGVTIELMNTAATLSITGKGVEYFQFVQTGEGNESSAVRLKNGDTVIFPGYEFSAGSEYVHLRYMVNKEGYGIQSLNGVVYSSIGSTPPVNEWAELDIPQSLFQSSDPKIEIVVGERSMVTLKITPKSLASHVKVCDYDNENTVYQDGSTIPADAHLKATFDAGYVPGLNNELTMTNLVYDGMGWSQLDYWDIQVREFDGDGVVTLPVVQALKLRVNDPTRISLYDLGEPTDGVYLIAPETLIMCSLEPGYELRAENARITYHDHGTVWSPETEGPAVGADGKPLVSCGYWLTYDSDADAQGTGTVTLSAVERTHTPRCIPVTCTPGVGVTAEELPDVLLYHDQWALLDDAELGDAANIENETYCSVTVQAGYAARPVTGCSLGEFLADPWEHTNSYSFLVAPDAQQVEVEIYKLAVTAGLTVKDDKNAEQVVSVDGGSYTPGVPVSGLCQVKVKNGYTVTAVEGGAVQSQSTSRERDGGIYTTFTIAVEKQDVVITVAEGTEWRWVTVEIDCSVMDAYYFEPAQQFEEGPSSGTTRTYGVLLDGDRVGLYVKGGFTFAVTGGTVTSYMYGFNHSGQQFPEGGCSIRVDSEPLRLKVVPGRFTLAAVVPELVESQSTAEHQLAGTLQNMASEITGQSGAVSDVAGLTNAAALKTAMDEGAAITALMNTSQEVSAGDQAALDGAVEKDALGNSAEYLDVSIRVDKIVTDEEGTSKTTQGIAAVTKLVEPVEFSYPLTGDAADGTDFHVLREHDGDIEELECRREGDVLLFSSDKFSSFAVVYTDPSKPAPTDAPAATDAPDSSAGTSPQTGDETPLALWTGMLALCLGGLALVLTLARRKRAK